MTTSEMAAAKPPVAFVRCGLPCKRRMLMEWPLQFPLACLPVQSFRLTVNYYWILKILHPSMATLEMTGSRTSESRLALPV